MNEIHITLPTVFGGILDDYRFKIFYGGRGGGKSWAICIALLILATNRRLKILCCREFQNSIADSVYGLLCDRIEAMGLSPIFDVTNNQIRCHTTGSRFLFKGLKTNPQSIKSLEGLDIVFIDEGQAIGKTSLELLVPTIRKKGSEIWVAMNPENESDPCYAQFVQYKRKNALVIRVNYYDNPFIDQVLLDEMEFCKQNNEDDFKHIWLGHVRKISHDVIMRNKFCVAEFVAPKGVQYYSGLDFGYAADPMAFVRCFVNNDQNELYIEHECYSYKVEIDEYDVHLNTIPGIKNCIINCDSANPGNISLLKRQGFNAVGAEKWPGSIQDGITHLRSYSRIIVHPRCKNMIKEFNNYRWKRDPKTLEIQPVPIDRDNHLCIDGTTLITTINGPTMLKDLKIGDLVQTRKGYRRVICWAYTGLKPCLEIRINNVNIVLTAEHPVHNGLDFIAAGSIQVGDIICMKYKSGIYTTLMKIGQIITHRYRECPRLIIVDKTRKVLNYLKTQKEQQFNVGLKDVESVPRNVNTWTTSILPKLGMLVQKVLRNTKELAHSRTRILYENVVSTATTSSSYQRLATLINSVAVGAKVNGVETLDLTINLEHAGGVKNLIGQTNTKKPKLALGVVDAITPVGLRPVYDITVEEEHEYFANDILVSNCDSLRYALGKIIIQEGLTADQWKKFSKTSSR